jgi:FHA domain
MAEPAWIIKWRAREALKNGQPEEAHRLLDGLIASGNRRAFALRADVVRGYLERAEGALGHHDVEAAWADLVRLEALADGDGGVVRLRDKLTRLGIAEIRASLEAGSPLQALKAAARLKERPATSPEIAPLVESAQEWVIAVENADRGDFASARTALERIRRRLEPQPAGLDRLEQEVIRREDHFRSAWNDLQEAAAAKDWRSMLRKADEVLAAAPQHKEAQQARNRAWQAVQPETSDHRPETRGLSSTGPHSLESVHDAETAMPKRFFLWIDGVGAWLVCLSPRIAIGQASPEGGPIDVPLVADVSRIHATLTRDEESYVLESNRDVQVNGRPITRAVLQSGDRIMISSCAMAFEQTVPGCLTAKLIVDGGRRLPMAVDGVLLMADMLVLGAGEKVHVRMPDLEEPFYLYRQKDRLGVRWQGEFSVEGQKCKDRALLPLQGTVSSDLFSFAIEPVGKS